MITTKVEEFTAQDATAAGLADAVKRGETTIGGYYQADSNLNLTLKQQTFTFTDNDGELRSGRFVSTEELLAFCKNNLGE